MFQRGHFTLAVISQAFFAPNGHSHFSPVVPHVHSTVCLKWAETNKKPNNSGTSIIFFLGVQKGARNLSGGTLKTTVQKSSVLTTLCRKVHSVLFYFFLCVGGGWKNGGRARHFWLLEKLMPPMPSTARN